MNKGGSKALVYAGLGLSLLLLTLGAGATNRPVRLGGPINFDLLALVGATMVLLGMLALRVRASGPAPYGLAVLLVAAAAGVNFYFYPPIPDGAYFLLRYGHDADERWPAEAMWHVVAFAGAAWSAALLAGAPASGRRIALETILAVLSTVLGALALQLFGDMLVLAAGPWPLAVGPLAGLAVAAALGWLGRRHPLVRLPAAFTALVAILAAALWVLWAQ